MSDTPETDAFMAELPEDWVAFAKTLELRCASIEADRTEARALAADAHRKFAEQRQRAEIAERDLADQRRKIVAQRTIANRLAVFASAYRSHPLRNPNDGLDTALADHRALN